MKRKVTRNELYRWSKKIIAIGYCNANNLLYPENSIGYNAGVYGWNYDAYYVDGTIITTGYRPIGERVNYDLLREYEEKAKKVLSYDNKADEKAAEVQRLLREFISKL